MIQQNNPQSNPGAIEALKAATRQVVQPAPAADTARGELKQARPPVGLESKQKPRPMSTPENFAEAFMRKITAVEQEKFKVEQEQLVVEQELNRVEKLQSGLTEKKKQLEARRNELIKVKDKLKELDKEMSDALKSQ